MEKLLYVFSGKFDSQEAALLYAEPQWEKPVPDDSWPEEDYEAWEDRNPTWKLKDDLNPLYMDSDFIETIYGDGRISYLRTQLKDAEAFASLNKSVLEEDNTLILIISSAFDTFEAPPMKDTEVLKYHGAFRWIE